MMDENILIQNKRENVMITKILSGNVSNSVLVQQLTSLESK